MTDHTDSSDAGPHLECEYCEAGFTRERSLSLHRGLEHEAVLTDVHRESYEAAVEAEERDLRRFRLLALGALIVLYFGLLMVYVLV